MPTRAFDDGSSDIPPRTPGETRRVIVVGAGVAGLTAANALTTAGVECVVVEARDRIGGRLHTVEVDGHPADLGGAWIHHPDDGNVLADWVDFASVPWIVDPTGTRFTGADLGEGRQLTDEELEGTGYGVFDPVSEQVRTQLDGGADDRSAAEAIDAYLADAVPASAERDRLRQLMASMVESDGAGPLDDISARWSLTEDMFVGDVVDNVPSDGYRSVLAALAAGSTIHLDRPVRRIEQARRRHRLGRRVEESGSHVIVTTSLGVLKHSGIEFVPPLPPERQAIIDRTGFGNLEKVVLAFAEPFWRDKDLGLRHSIIYSADRGEAATWTWDFGLAPTLMFLVSHSTAPSMWRDPEAFALEALRGGVRRAAARPTDGRGVDRLAPRRARLRRLRPHPPGRARQRLRHPRRARRPDLLRRRAHPGRAGRLRRRRHDQRAARGQAAAPAGVGRPHGALNSLTTLDPCPSSNVLTVPGSPGRSTVPTTGPRSCWSWGSATRRRCGSGWCPRSASVTG